MTPLRITAVALALLAIAGLCDRAAAQLIYSLPKDDFIWNWGALERRRSANADISVRGHESRFRCELTADLRPGSFWSTTDIREFENDLSTSLQFIYDASQAMNVLDARRELDWATLDCKLPEEQPVSEAEKLERENKARERMMREIERRRARAGNDDDR